MQSKVIFCKNLSPEKIIDVYETLNFPLKGNNICIKIHSGEKGNKNFLDAEYLKPIIQYIDGTVVECNTAYNGARNTTEKHLQLMKDHNWDQFKYDILDSEQPDFVIDNPNGKIIKKDYVGKNIKNYDSCVIISHVKGHPMGGFGASLKQLSIGFASSKGKVYIHGHGNFDIGYKNLNDVKSDNQLLFIQSMADAANAVFNYFKNKIVFLNILKNISISCDCDSNAPISKMKDIGILASIDPVAIDQASLDLIINSNDKNKDEIINRINELNGYEIIRAAQNLGMGNTSYKLIEIE